MEKAIKDVLSEGKNGVKLHSAVQKSFGKYLVEVAPIENMADLPQDVGEWILTGMEAWKNDPGGELPATRPSSLLAGGGVGLVQVAGGVLLSLGLIVFAQVPVGQDSMDPVSYLSVTDRVESPDQIKKRYASFDDEASY